MESDRDVANLALDILEHIHNLRPNVPGEMAPLFLRHIADVWDAGYTREIIDEMEFSRRLGSFEPYVLSLSEEAIPGMSEAILAAAASGGTRKSRRQSSGK